MNSIALLLAAATLGAEPELAWKQTDHSLALTRGPAVVWQFNYKKEEGKPYFHPITLAGSSSLTDLRPADHPWHRALWFSWKFINGVLYWEEDPKTGKAPGETELIDAKATARADHSARFELALSYHPPAKPAVLTEKRTLEVSPPGKDGGYFIDWQSVFTAGDVDVRLDRTPILGQPGGVGYGGYAGMSLRLAPALRGWQFVGSEGPVNKLWTEAQLDVVRRLAREGKVGDDHRLGSSEEFSSSYAVVSHRKHAVLQPRGALPGTIHPAGGKDSPVEAPDHLPARSA